MLKDDALVANAGDKRQVREAGKKERWNQVQKEERFKRLMQNEDFRAFLWELLGETHIFESGFALNAVIYFNAGQREIGLKYFGMATSLTPQLYLTMADEGNRPSES